MNYEQGKQHYTLYYIHCTNSSDAFIQPNLFESWNSLEATGNVQEHTAILEVLVYPLTFFFFTYFYKGKFLQNILYSLQ